RLTRKSGRWCPAASWLAGELAELIPFDLRSEWRGGHGPEAFGPGHPGFGLRLDETNQQHPPLTQLLHVIDISGMGYRNHYALFLVGSRYRHGGIIPQKAGKMQPRLSNEIAPRGNFGRSLNRHVKSLQAKSCLNYVRGNGSYCPRNKSEHLFGPFRAIRGIRGKSFQPSYSSIVRMRSAGTSVR